MLSLIAEEIIQNLSLIVYLKIKASKFFEKNFIAKNPSNKNCVSLIQYMKDL